VVQESSSGGEGQTATATRKYTRSFSQLKAYTKCGEAFYLERFKRADLPRRPAAWTILGISIHETIMAWEASDRTLDVYDFFDASYEALAAVEWLKQPEEKYWILPPRTNSVRNSIQNYKKRGFEQLEKYLEQVEDSPWEISSMERPFQIDLDGITVKGAVDRILFFPGCDEYIVEDLKSGSPDDEDDKRQLAFYAFIAREQWDIPVTKGRYWYTKVDRPSSTENLERFGKKFWVETFKKLDSGINQQLFLPSPGKHCFLCSVKPWCSTQGWLKIGEEF
jgi:hypothetical protein